MREVIWRRSVKIGHYLKCCSQVSNTLGVFLSNEEETLFFLIEFLFGAQKKSFLLGQIVLGEELFAFSCRFTDLQGENVSMQLTFKEREKYEKEKPVV